METLLNYVKMEKLGRKFSYNGVFSVKPVGNNGGLALLYGKTMFNWKLPITLLDIFVVVGLRIRVMSQDGCLPNSTDIPTLARGEKHGLCQVD